MKKFNENIIYSTTAVDIDFIRAAYKAACPEWKQKIEEQFPSLFESAFDTLKQTKEYKEFIYQSLGEEKSITLGSNYVAIALPSANDKWAKAALNLAQWLVNNGFSYRGNRYRDSYPLSTDMFTAVKEHNQQYMVFVED